MKKVLFIVYYFPPMGGSGVQRPLKFVKYLRDFGWNPVVLCPEPGMYPFFDESLMVELEEMNMEVHRINPKTLFHTAAGSSKKKKALPDFIAKIIRRILRFFMYPDNKKGWIKPAVEKGVELINDEEIDLIFSTAPPFSNHIIGKELKKNSGKPLVLDYRDAWLNNHFMTGMFDWQKKKMYKLEKECVESSDVVIGLDEEMLKEMKVSYPDLDKLKVLPHGYDPDDLTSNTPATLEYKTGKLNFLYSGIFYESNQPDNFLKALSLAIEDSSIRTDDIHLHFQGGLDARIHRFIKKLGFQKIVTDYGYLNHEQAVANLKKADVLWMISNFSPILKQVKSGKLFEYFGAKKPILGLTHAGAESNLLKKYGAGFIADVDEPQQIAKAIQDIFQQWKKGNEFAVNNNFVENFNRKNLSKKLAEIFNEISSNN